MIVLYEIYHSNCCLQFRGPRKQDLVLETNVLMKVFLEVFKRLIKCSELTPASAGTA